METLPITLPDVYRQIIDTRLQEHRNTPRYFPETNSFLYQGKAYMTLEALRDFLGVKQSTMSRSWERNKAELTEGEHYILLKGAELAAFKRLFLQRDDSSSNSFFLKNSSASSSVGISGNAKHLYLISHIGAINVAGWFTSALAKQRYNEMLFAIFDKAERYERALIGTYQAIHSGMSLEQIKQISTKILQLSTTEEEREMIAEKYALTEEGKARITAQENYAKQGLSLPHKSLLTDCGCFATGQRYAFRVAQDMQGLSEAGRKSVHGKYRAFLPHFQRYADVSGLRLFVDRSGFQFEPDAGDSYWDDEAEELVEVIQAAPSGMIDAMSVPYEDYFTDEIEDFEETELVEVEELAFL